ncbi:MAG: signal recognition particle protein [Candidatus Marinimicrobia bacterium]|nr:signal recognition particle protein [Candidatus Neomarinimicrobiota bacterium]MBL7023270.1 signal recognition particle protein [Candidatus Neomarinimicrobiota bacterium]MBL7108864.1 signal recognition particle protein [Candidatus Neomarinimicrobiota bacterium]
MFEQLQDRFSSIFKTIRGHGKITESNISDAMRDVRRALLEADVNFKVARRFVDRITDKAKGGEVLTSITPGQQFIKIIQKELTEFLGGNTEGIQFSSSGFTTIVMAGLQGSGKTTTCAKLARFLKNKRQKNPFLIAADLQRPAAVDQLKVLGKQIDVPVYSEDTKDPLKVVKNGISQAKSQDADLIIIDTAGRLHVDETLMNQLKNIVSLSNPNEILFVADGMTGQDAVNSSKAFSETVDVTGIVLTKMDGDSRGGAAVSIREVTGKPIKFIGTSENMDGFEPFHPDRLSQRILGMGDVVSLVEKAQEFTDKKSAEKLQKKLEKNSFTLEDFQDQLKQIQKMGSFSQLISMIPGAGKLKNLNMDDSQLKWVEAIIFSMTPTEKRNPNIINGSRRKRIAKGSGRPVFEVNQLLKQFAQMKLMMKKMGKSGMPQMPFKI